MQKCLFCADYETGSWVFTLQSSWIFYYFTRFLVCALVPKISSGCSCLLLTLTLRQHQLCQPHADSETVDWNYSARGELHRKCLLGDWLGSSFFECFKLLEIRLEGDIVKLGILVYSLFSVVTWFVLIVVVQFLSCVHLSATLWTMACLTPCPLVSPRICSNSSVELVMPSNCLILCRPLLFLFSIFSSI